MRFGLAAFSVVIITVALAGCYDDPFYPRPPYYDYTVTITGLDGFTTDNGTAFLYIPIPAAGGEPILQEGWWANYRLNDDEERHGTRWLAPVNTTYGPMLGAEINETDYYFSYARVTPIAIYPGMNMSKVPRPVPDRIDKSPSFDDMKVVASGYVQRLDYPTSANGRKLVAAFLEHPLLPAVNVMDGDHTSYVYVDERLRPLNNNCTIHISATLRVSLNHNKVNASEEGARLFEVHTFEINETMPANVTGFIPVQVRHTRSTSTYYL